jgi:hypothetical protein
MDELSVEQQTEQFMERLGEPALQFTAPTDAVTLPPGLLPCCRVIHQYACENHVARSLVGAATVMMDIATGAETEIVHPRPVSALGDIMADPPALFSAIRAHWLMAEATARRRLAEIKTMQVAIFLLTPEQAQAWIALEAKIQEYAQNLAVTLSENDRILLMPFAAIPDPDTLAGEDRAEVLETIAEVKGSEDWHDVSTYANIVVTWPTEIGRTDSARYVVGDVTEPERDGVPWMGDPSDPANRAVGVL